MNLDVSPEHEPPDTPHTLGADRARIASSPGTPVIGLTGAPAAGKSTVARLFSDAGCDVVDADALGHAALERADVRAEVAAAFGDDVLDARGALDRGRLAALVFADPAALHSLEEIVHPRVRAEIARRVAVARSVGMRAVVLDAALLFETGLAASCDVTVTVHAEPSIREERARATRGWDRATLVAREARQLPATEKLSRADRVIVNEGDAARLGAAVRNLLAEVAPTPHAAPTGRRI